MKINEAYLLICERAASLRELQFRSFSELSPEQEKRRQREHDDVSDEIHRLNLRADALARDAIHWVGNDLSELGPEWDDVLGSQHRLAHVNEFYSSKSPVSSSSPSAAFSSGSSAPFLS